MLPQRPRFMNKLRKIPGAIFLLIVILGSLFLLRLPSCFIPLWNVDEAVSACIANVIVDGGIPYRDAIDHRGPVTYYAYALIFNIFGKNNMPAVHIALSGLLLCVSVVIYACGTYVANKRAGLLTALFFTILSFGAFREGDMLAAHTEYVVIFFTSIAVYFLLRSLSHNNFFLLFLCGTCYGIAFFAKQPASLDLAAVFVFLELIAFFRQDQSPPFLKRVVCLACGFLLVTLYIILYFYTRGALQDFFFYFWTYNTKYYVPEIPFLMRIRNVLVPVKGLYSKFFFVPILFFSGSLYSLYDFFTLSPRGSGLFKKDFYILFVLLTGAAFVGASLSGRTFGHYYIQMLPALCIIIGISTEKLFTVIQPFFIRAFSKKLLSAHSILAGTFIACCIGSFLLPLPSRLYHSFSSPLRKDREEEVVQYIKNSSTDHDHIFVWGFYPELYVLSHRMPASRYTFTNVLTGLIPWTNIGEDVDTAYAIVPGTWEILMKELHENQPLLFVDASPVYYRNFGKYDPETFPALHRFLEQNYQLEFEISSDDESHGFKIYKRKNQPNVKHLGSSTFTRC
ncbi:hypothetical protein CSA56_04760 [candidate division KSB3 bacterium]|uniref:Glycosyltransferase RgtA/B/C/D-like domain-containing protein n=1 Tax=candidate division KSB3 bacterium TaxID=2044937 RepID=A0A2G6KI15_9BACT|nr:MAG: hypothetical protein CSA56_04760 [candidate division KSB3 bacterium]